MQSFYQHVLGLGTRARGCAGQSLAKKVRGEVACESSPLGSDVYRGDSSETLPVDATTFPVTVDISDDATIPRLVECERQLTALSQQVNILELSLRGSVCLPVYPTEAQSAIVHSNSMRAAVGSAVAVAADASDPCSATVTRADSTAFEDDVSECPCDYPAEVTPEDAPHTAAGCDVSASEVCLPSAAEMAHSLIAWPGPCCLGKTGEAALAKPTASTTDASACTRRSPDHHMQAMLMDVVEVLQNRGRGACALLVTDFDAAYQAYWDAPLDIQDALGVDLITFLKWWPAHFVLLDVCGQPTVRLRRPGRPGVV